MSNLRPTLMSLDFFKGGLMFLINSFEQVIHGKMFEMNFVPGELVHVILFTIGISGYFPPPT